MNKERPILFNGPMVRAILDGRKTMTRRIVKPQPEQPASACHSNHVSKHAAPYLDAYCSQHKTTENPRGMSDQWCWWQIDDRQCLPTFRCPYGQPGDKLWVRETWDFRPWPTNDCPGAVRIAYGADGHQLDAIAPAGWNPLLYSRERWRPSIHMPRWASRITLEIVSVRVERLQDIDEHAALKEGVDGWVKDTRCETARDGFITLWESINGPGSWDANPWVWAIEFKRIEQAWKAEGRQG